MLIVILILGIAGVLVVVILTQALKGNNKTQVLSSIKKNGEQVLGVIDNAVRNADNVVCVSNDNKTLAIVQGGKYTRYRFISPADSALGNCGGNNNGCVAQDNPVQPTPPALESDVNLFVQNACTDPLSNPITLSDTDLQTGASITNGSFTRNTHSGFKDTITIGFQVIPPVSAPSSIAGQIDPVSFSTTVELR